MAYFHAVTYWAFNLCQGLKVSSQSQGAWQLHWNLKFPMEFAHSSRNSRPVAVGVNPWSAKYCSLKNLLRCLIPLSRRIVTIVCPGPKSWATLTAPTQFMADELPTNSPSFLSKNLNYVPNKLRSDNLDFRIQFCKMKWQLSGNYEIRLPFIAQNILNICG